MNNMPVQVHPHPTINTYTVAKEANGFLVPLYNVNEETLYSEGPVEQVYLTVIAPLASKGPHLHYIRSGSFTCISGNIRVVVKVGDRYEVFYSGEKHGYATIQVPQGIPARLDNLERGPALVLNMPKPAWRPDMHDEHTADFTDFVASAEISVAELENNGNQAQ